jgi:hypothetical protein
VPPTSGSKVRLFNLAQVRLTRLLFDEHHHLARTAA